MTEMLRQSIFMTNDHASRNGGSRTNHGKSRSFIFNSQGGTWTNGYSELVLASSDLFKVISKGVSLQGLPRWFCFEWCLVDIEEDRQGLGTGPCFYHGCCVRQPAHDVYGVGQTTEMIAMTATRRMMRMMQNGVWALLSPKCYSSFCWHILGSHCP